VADPGAAYARLERALAEVEPPFALLDLDALWANADDVARRAAGKPVRLASKSLRCRALQDAALARPGFRGLMTFTLPETLWLHGLGHRDLLLAYPTADRTALAALGALEGDGRPIVVVDGREQLDLIAAATDGRPAAPVRVCIEFDTSLELAGGRVRVGTKRSPLRTPAQVAALAREILARAPALELAGLMGYEGHVAGVGDRPANPALGFAVRRMQRAARAQLAERRAAVVAAVRDLADVALINGGGTGSLESTAAEGAVSEVAAGSGLYGPALFDRYTGFRPRPAAMFCLPVVRKPAPGVATVLGGGYLASGAPGADRLPAPHLPAGLRLTRSEGAGEVQTPLTGRGAAALQVGDRVYLRHAKAGELGERFASFHLVQGDAVVDEVPTYRGEGKAFL